MRFLHCADVHLDSPLLGLEQRAGDSAEVFRLATRQAFSNVVRTALERAVDFVVIAGDLYDSALKGYESPLFFGREMERLHSAGIQVALIFGNHDFAAGRDFVLRLPPNVYVFRDSAPGSHEIQPNVWVHGQSLPRRHVNENLARNYPAAVPDAINIGVLHTSLSGAAGHEPYAPCNLTDLESRNYDYWALGHIHERRCVAEMPRVEFPGCTQGRHFRETGEKGCLLVDLEPTTKVATVEFVPTAAALWDRCEVDATSTRNIDEVLDRVRERLRAASESAADRPLAVRLVIRGTTPAHAQLCDAERLRHEVLNLAAEGTWVEKVLVETNPEGAPEDWLQRSDPLGEIVRAVRLARGDPAQWPALAAGLTALRQKLPPEAGAEPEPLTLDADQIAGWLPQVEADLIRRLARGGAEVE